MHSIASPGLDCQQPSGANFPTHDIMANAQDPRNFGHRIDGGISVFRYHGTDIGQSKKSEEDT
jgi:hypothetical protein